MNDPMKFLVAGDWVVCKKGKRAIAYKFVCYRKKHMVTALQFGTDYRVYLYIRNIRRATDADMAYNVAYRMTNQERRYG